MKYLIWSLISLLTISCASGHCKRGKPNEDAVKAKTEAQTERVFVHKPDGSVQCAKQSGKSLEATAKDLDGITIHSKKKKSDGNMRIQVCGAATGISNVYEIDAANLQRALDVGFKVWKDPGV